MVPSTRQAIACLLFICIAAVCAQSQVAPAKTATISGKVSFKNKGLAGIVVAARISNASGLDKSRYRATTDQSGNYRITNLPTGTFQVAPIAPGLVQEKALFEKSVVIEEGDNVEDVNFSLVRGGVITGKITDADGKPMVEQQISFQAEDQPNAQVRTFASMVMTDDRGVYRAFGLRPGKYKVFVGQGQDDNRLPGYGPYQQTFYPSVTEPAKAIVVEVSEGSEADDIDIVMGRPFTAFKVTGRIIDGESGKPVPNISYGIYASTNGGSSLSSGGDISNANGEFRFEGVMPGKYSVFVEPQPNSDMRAEPVPFEVVDHDLTGLVIKTIKAASISGVVIVEGTDDPAAVAKIGSLWVHAMSDPAEGQIHQGSAGQVGPDGTFTVRGLSPGVVNFGLGVRNRVNKPLALVRVERDGILQPSGVSVKDGEQLTGVRLIIKMLTATIRGQVKVEDGELPTNVRLSIWLHPLEESRPSFRVMSTNSSPQIDSRGRFLIEGIPAGTYEINIGVFESDRFDASRVFKQQVTVADNSVSEVTVMIKLKP